MRTEASDRADIRDGIDSWVILRDTGQWERFAKLWHPQGRMHATWFQAHYTDFIERGRKAFDAGTSSIHTCNGIAIDLAGDRAAAQSRFSIVQRGLVHGAPVNVVCYGRFWDAWEYVSDRWLLRLRQPIYDTDYMIPADPHNPPVLDQAVLNQYPSGYRNLAYLQLQLGMDVYRTMPGTRGPEIDALMAISRAWLAGEDASRLDRALPTEAAAHA